jgi:release factor glutamine methyltransferase
MNQTTITRALTHAQTRGLARIDAQLLMLHVCGRALHDRAWLIAHGGDVVIEAQSAAFEDAVQRRLKDEPVAYITGRKAFYGLELHITRDVLDPRDDTETLVDWALALIPHDAPWQVADLGTGSGAMALAMASQRPQAQVLATDASSAALAVAQANATRLNLPVQCIQGNESDWFAPLSNRRFHLIASNPPYIADGDTHLAKLSHEPAMALTSGADGLDAVRAIIAQAPEHLQPGGWLLLEHGHDQAERVRALLAARGFTAIQSRRDLAGIERCSGGQRP